MLSVKRSPLDVSVGGTEGDKEEAQAYIGQMRLMYDSALKSLEPERATDFTSQFRPAMMIILDTFSKLDASYASLIPFGSTKTTMLKVGLQARDLTEKMAEYAGIKVPARLPDVGEKFPWGKIFLGLGIVGAIVLVPKLIDVVRNR